MRHRLIKILIILAVLASLAGVASAQTKEDLNGDGKVNSLDALMALKMAKNDTNKTPYDAGEILKVSAGSGLRALPPKPVADFTMGFIPDTYIAFFNASLSRGEGLGYAWNFGDGQVGEGIGPEHEYAGPGAYNVTLGVKDRYGRTNFTTRSLYILFTPGANDTFVNRTPIANFTVTPTGMPGEMRFDGTSSKEANLSRGSTLEYSWNFGDGTGGNGAIVTHRYLRTGIYVATLTVVDDAGRSDYARAAVRVRSASGLPDKSTSDDTSITISLGFVIANFTIDKPMAGEPGALIMNATPSLGDNLTYAWDMGDGTTGAGMIVNHTFAIPGTYNITLMVTDDGGLNDSMTRRISLANGSSADVVARFIGGPWNGTAPLTVKFNAYQSADPFAPPEFNWDFGDGTKGSGMIVAHTYTAPGKYRATLVMSDDLGYSDAAYQTIVVYNTVPSFSPVFVTRAPTLMTPTPSTKPTLKPTPTNKPPIAHFDYTYNKSVLGLNAAKSYDPDGTIARYEWSMKNLKTNAVTGLGTSPTVKWTMTQVGTYDVKLRVTDNGGATDTYSEMITIASV